MNILVLGASGLVGSAAAVELVESPGCKVFGTYMNNKPTGNFYTPMSFNIDNITDIKSILYNDEINGVISCLRGDFGKLLEVHRVIADYLKAVGGKLYFCSTANVFDNDLTKPHYEYDLQDAVSEYGKFKIECERMISEVLKERGIVMRLPQVWGKAAPRFTECIEKLEKGEAIETFSNLYINTNIDTMLAKQIRYIIENELEGIFHLGAEDMIKHGEFYIKLAEKLGYDSRQVQLKEESEEEQYFAVLSGRNELPRDLRFTNDAVIKHLTA